MPLPNNMMRSQKAVFLMATRVHLGDRDITWCARAGSVLVPCYTAYMYACHHVEAPDVPTPICC